MNTQRFILTGASVTLLYVAVVATGTFSFARAQSDADGPVPPGQPALPMSLEASASPPDSQGTEAAAQDPSYHQSIIEEQEKDIVAKAYPLLAAIWPQAEWEIFVCWEKMSDDFEAEREIVRKAIKESWEAYSNLEFYGWKLCPEASTGIRIRVIDDADLGPHTRTLGYFLNGLKNGMTLNFTYKNWGQDCQESKDFCTKVIAIHEFGHAIGLAHEQNRPDAPGECQKLRQGPDGDDYLLTPYDPESVMNYCNLKYANFGVLSAKDISFLKEKYGY